MRSVIGTNPVTRAAAAFLVGGLAVLVVHQPVVGLLHALGSTPIMPYNLRATRRAVRLRGRTKAYNVSRVPFPNCRSGVIGLAIAGNPENDGHLSPWQEAVGHEIIPDTHKNGCANEATTGLTLGLFVMLFQDVVFG